MKELITPKTGAETKSLYIVNDKFVSLAASFLAGAEEITINILLAGVSTPVIPKIALTASENIIQLAGPNTYEIVKPTTAGAVGVYTVT